MMPKQAYIISLFWLLCLHPAVAQKDSLRDEEPAPIFVDSAIIANKYAIELSVDYGKPIESIVTNQSKWEFGAGFILKNKLALVGEYGYGKLVPEGVIQNGTYQVEGNYLRAGAEYIFTIAPKRYLAIGGMYATSAYSDYGQVQITSELWPDVNEEFTRQSLTASWAELILNTQGAIVNAETGFLSNLYWGIRFRLRIMITDLDRTDFDIYAVPGYGKTYSNVLPAANLFLRYRFNF